MGFSLFQVLLLLRCAFSCTFHFSGVLFTDAPYTHTCTICTYMHHQLPHACPIKGTYMCTIYTYMHHQTHVHHQIPPKYKIYPVGFPSVLYETPGPNERSVLNQLFFGAFNCAFHFSGAFSWKPQCFSWKLQRFFIVSFWVITKYRSLIRKNQSNGLFREEWCL